MKKYILILLTLFVVTVGSLAETKKYDFNLTQNIKGKLILNFDKGRIDVEIDNERHLVSKYKCKNDDNCLEDFTGFSPYVKNVIFVDYNFDGYVDFGVLRGTGYMGVNEYRDYYFYNPNTKQYNIQIKIECNLDVYSKENKILKSWEKSSQSFGSKIYMVNKFGDIFLALSAIGKWSANEEEGMIYTYDSNAKVNANRAYYYDKPKGKKSKIYLVKGDHVKVLDLIKDNKKMWTKVAYKGKHKTYRGWVKFTDLTFKRLK